MPHRYYILSANTKYEKHFLSSQKYNVNFTLSPGRRPGNSRVTGGATVNIGGTSCTSSTITITSKPAMFLVSWPPSAYASYTLKRNILFLNLYVQHLIHILMTHITYERKKRYLFRPTSNQKKLCF